MSGLDGVGGTDSVSGAECMDGRMWPPPVTAMAGGHRDGTATARAHVGVKIK